eukprot:scaffold2735_cov114-Isochrysis_galbana.AAC.4
MTARPTSAGKGGTLSCSCTSPRMYGAGSRSWRMERAWPTCVKTERMLLRPPLYRRLVALPADPLVHLHAANKTTRQAGQRKQPAERQPRTGGEEAVGSLRVVVALPIRGGGRVGAATTGGDRAASEGH